MIKLKEDLNWFLKYFSRKLEGPAPKWDQVRTEVVNMLGSLLKRFDEEAEIPKVFVDLHVHDGKVYSLVTATSPVDLVVSNGLCGDGKTTVCLVERESVEVLPPASFVEKVYDDLSVALSDGSVDSSGLSRLSKILTK